MAALNSSIRPSIHAVSESYLSGICSVSSTIGTFADFAASVILPVRSVSYCVLTTSSLISPDSNASVNCLMSVGVGSLSLAVACA